MQMKHLAQSGYQSLTLSEAAKSIREKKPFPEKGFVMTFDDGYENNYTQAFPIVQEFGFKGTVFLVSDSCEKSWSDHGAIEERPMLSWAEISEMHRYGIEFGAHTSTHPDLTRIPIEQAEREIVDSKTSIQDRLGAEVTTFAYPYGKFNAQIKSVVSSQFCGACSTKLGTAQLGCDPFSLQRIDMYYLRDFRVFNKLATTPFAWYLRLRRVLRDIKASV